MCSPKNLDLCDDAKKAEITKFQSMSDADLDKAIAEEEKKLEDAEAEFKAEVQKLQDKYTALSTEKDEKIAAVKAAGLGLMRAVKASKPSGKDELEGGMTKAEPPSRLDSWCAVEDGCG